MNNSVRQNRLTHWSVPGSGLQKASPDIPDIHVLVRLCLSHSRSAEPANLSVWLQISGLVVSLEVSVLYLCLCPVTARNKLTRPMSYNMHDCQLIGRLIHWEFLLNRLLEIRRHGGQIWDQDLRPKWVRLAPNGTNLWLLKIIFSVHFGLASQNVL